MLLIDPIDRLVCHFTIRVEVVPTLVNTSLMGIDDADDVSEETAATAPQSRNNQRGLSLTSAILNYFGFSNVCPLLTSSLIFHHRMTDAPRPLLPPPLPSLGR